MKNEIKLPRLSMSFSENGRSAKRRFENILSLKKNKKGIAAFSLVIILMGIAGTLVACNNGSVGIIGGADGTTAVFVDKKDNQKSDCENLYEARTQYVGNASKVGRIIGLLEEVRGAEADGMQLQTTTEPYGIMRWLSGDIEDMQQIENQAAIILSLVENAGYVSYSLDKGENIISSFSREQLGVEYAKSYEAFEALYNSLYPINKQMTVEEAVSKAILNHNETRYADGECIGEGHVILGEEDYADGGKVVYALTMYGQYGFENNAFIKTSGSGIIPAQIVFDSEYNVLEFKMPMDGGMYISSCKEMFPQKYWNDVLGNNEKYYSILTEQEEKYAAEYLKKIGREAQIGKYADIGHDLTDMNASASNELFDTYYEYPYWIGTLERIENGIRYVYETQWDSDGNGDGVVTFKKYEYDTKRVEQEIVLNISDGEIIALKGEPRKARKQ